MTTLCKNGVAVEQAGQQHGDNHDFGVQPAVVRPVGFFGVVAAISPRTHEHARKGDEHQSSNNQKDNQFCGHNTPNLAIAKIVYIIKTNFPLAENSTKGKGFFG
jgi:hypothetical protein